MGSLRRKTFTKPLPENAELFEKKKQQFARWNNAAGKTRTAPTIAGKDGSLRIVITSGRWLIKYRDGSGIIREVSTGCGDKQAAKAQLAVLERRAELVRCGIVSQSEHTAADHQSRPLREHFADFRQSMVSKERDDTHCKTTLRYLERMADACGWIYLKDINRDSVEKWQSGQVRTGTSARTRNGFHTALVSFLNWCVEGHRITVNPIVGVPKANETTDRRRQRRALNEDQIRRLLDTTRRRPLEEAMTIRRGSCKGELSADVKPEFAAQLAELGRERALIYKTLLLTGLRKGELESLAIDQVELDGPMPYLMLDAADEKNRQGSDIPLRADLAEDLREWIDHKRATYCGPEGEFRQKPLFDVPTGLLRILNRDLEAAGIPKRDERGRTVDVHALRTTFGTLLSKGGVAPRTAQAAMRHSDISLTMSVYTDPKLLDVHGAMNALPELPLNHPDIDRSISNRATGTAGPNQQLPPVLPPGTVLTRHSGTSPVPFSAATTPRRVGELVAVTSAPVMRKGSLTSTVNEPLQSGRQDLNLRPLDPQSSALPGCATSRIAFFLDMLLSYCDRLAADRICRCVVMQLPEAGVRLSGSSFIKET